MKPSISIIIPALNEEASLKKTIQDTLAVLDGRFSSYEMIIINDGSSDQTASIADQISLLNRNVRVIHHGRNMGLGYSVREGYDLVTKDYTVWNPGDGGMKSLDSMFNYIGQADLIIPYIVNPEFRSRLRRLISRTYVIIMDFLFGLKIRCYNGTVIYRTDLIKTARASTYGYFFFAETLILILKKGCTYLEVPTFHEDRAHGKSKAFTFKNIAEILKKAVSLAWNVHFNKSEKNNVPAEIKVH